MRPICLLYVLFFTLSSLVSNGQKLPDLQTISLKAPETAKADGKNLEWKDSFQAFNKRTDVFYTICNDTENLYLVIKSTDPVNNNKIMSGGISFTINKEGKKKDNEGVIITYPLVKRGSSRRMGMSGGTPGGGVDQVSVHRSQLFQAREIKIKGVAGLKDSLISIYNLHRIKAFASVDTSGAFFYELSIPLQIAALKPDAEFTYNVKVNGIQMGSIATGGGGVVSGRMAAQGTWGRGRPESNRLADFQSMMSPTDFWGTYRIAK